MNKPDIRDGDWVLLKFSDFPARAGSLRRMGRGWQVWVDVPAVSRDGYVEKSYEWVSVKLIEEVRRWALPLGEPISITTFIGSGNQASPEHSATTRRSEAP